MTREIDRAIENQEQITEMNIQAIRDRANQQEAKATGSCLFCGEPLDKSRRWCDKDCASDWERERRMKGLIS